MCVSVCVWEKEEPHLRLWFDEHASLFIVRVGGMECVCVSMCVCIYVCLCVCVYILTQKSHALCACVYALLSIITLTAMHSNAQLVTVRRM